MPLPDDINDGEWEALTTARYAVTDEAVYFHADAILRAHPDLKNSVVSGLSFESPVNPIWRDDRGTRFKGISVTGFNKKARDHLAFHGFQTEAAIVDSVIYDEGPREEDRFDIVRYDYAANLARLWNVCFGRRRLDAGQDHWEACITQRPHWRSKRAFVEAKAPAVGRDIDVEANEPTVLGEIQKGNWGLLSSDLFKLKVARRQLEIDLFVYIVPGPVFSSLLSKQTVSLDLAKRKIEKYRREIDVPVWLVGVDIVDMN